MGRHVNSRARAIRLPNDLWERIEEEAGGLNMSVNEFVRRRLSTGFPRVRENRKPFNIDRIPDDEEVIFLP